jgi:hypothetical protein
MASVLGASQFSSLTPNEYIFMNRLPSSEEIARRPDWVEGHWITLTDGLTWSFAPPAAIPGYEAASREATRIVVDNVLSLLNMEAIRKSGQQASAGDPSNAIRSIGQVFALYQVVFWAGSTLLKRNYRVTDADCDRLMPFNYQLTDLADPQSRVHQTTPETLAICNAIAAISGINIGPALARITTSN